MNPLAKPRRRLPAVLSVCAVTLVSASPAMPQKAEEIVDLSPRFEVGVPALYEHVLTMTQKRRFQQFGEGIVSLQMFTDLRLETTRLLPGGAEVQLTFDRLAIEALPAALPRAVYDSDKDRSEPTDDPFVRALRRIAQSVIVFRVNADGVVSPISGVREITRLVETLEGHELVATLFNGAWLQELVEDIYSPSPGAPRRPAGASWDDVQSLWLGGVPGARTTVRWRIEDASADRARLTGEGFTTPPVEPHPMLRGLEQRVSGRFSRFSLVWDHTLGRTSSVEKAQAMSLEYIMEDRAIATVTLGGHSLLTMKDQ